MPPDPTRDSVETTLRGIARNLTRTRPSLEDDVFQEARLAAWLVAERGGSEALQVHAGRQGALDALRGRNHRLSIAQARAREPVSLDEFLAPRGDLNEGPHVHALTAADHAGIVDVRVTVQSAVARLPHDDRLFVHLRFHDEMWLTDVGAALGITENAAKKRWKARIAPALRRSLTDAA